MLTLPSFIKDESHLHLGQQPDSIGEKNNFLQIVSHNKRNKVKCWVLHSCFKSIIFTHPTLNKNYLFSVHLICIIPKISSAYSNSQISISFL